VLVIDTGRLNIFPLDQFNLELCISDFNEMERVIGLAIQ
jgi:hypothetical protein